MNGAEGDVDGLVLGDQLDLGIDGHFGGASDDDPVFGAVMVALERKRRTGVDDDALHLKARANHKAFVPAPRAIIARQGFGLRHGFGFQRGDGLFNLLRTVLVGDEHRVGHRDG